jgi:hypothetical protein
MDVFVSYARPDGVTAERLAAALRACGWSVWVDSALQAGEYWDETIEAALREARCVVVLWSKASVQSHWVRTEAEQARQRGILVPARIASIELPYGFARLHTADLSDWVGRDEHKGFRELIAGVATMLQHKPETSRHTRRTRKRIWRAALLVIAAGTIGITLLLSNLHRDWMSFGLEINTTGLTFTPDRSSEISDLLVISQFAALGIDKLEIPRTKRTPTRTLDRVAGQPGVVKLMRDDAHGRGSITLAPLLVPSGSSVSITAGGGRQEFRIRADSKRPVTLSVDGVVGASLQGSPWEIFDFGFPKPMTLYAGDTGTDVTVRLSATEADLLPVPLSVKSLNLTRVDERMDKERSVVHEVSTVISGTLRVDPGNLARRLANGERVVMDQPLGRIQEIRLAADHIAVRFEGKARTVLACADEFCQDLRPSAGRSLWHEHRTLSMAIGAGLMAILALLLFLSSSR